jgi:hypothetical protein
MINVSRMLLLVPLSLLSIACATPDKAMEEKYKEPGAMDLIICTEPRPQICTREYDPVCATLLDGNVKTYSTGCTSCSDDTVKGYRPGEC